MQTTNPLRLAKLLLALCFLHMSFVGLMAAAIYSPATGNALMVTRAEAIYIIGENNFGLIRIKPFEDIDSAKQYVHSRGWKIPEFSHAYIRPVARKGKLLSSNRVTWSFADQPSEKKTPVIETNSQSTASFFNKLVENGILKESRMGFAVHLERQND
jgi:hypothetical protein